MKKFSILFVCLLVTTVTLVNCKKEKNVESQKNAVVESNAPDQAKLNQALSLNPTTLITEAAISYKGVLCPGVTVSGSFAGSNIGNSALWDYYSFSGIAGDVVTIYAPRTGNCRLDPSFSLYSGTTTDNTGVTTGNGGANMTFLAFRDDNTAQVCTPAGACFSDPTLSSFVLPSTGTYTVAVQSFANCAGGGPYTYNLTLTVNSYSNLVIDGCNSGVPNIRLTCSTRMSDAIAACAVGVTNHGQFVSCVAHLTNQWKKAGLITGAQKDAIMDCAGSSSIGH